MIKLNKSLNPPATLQSNQVQQEQQRISNLVASGLLPTYKDFKSDLYGAADVKAQLLSDQYDKCIFCEEGRSEENIEFLGMFKN